jgi:predicted nucleic acid-binding protein
MSELDLHLLNGLPKEFLLDVRKKHLLSLRETISRVSINRTDNSCRRILFAGLSFGDPLVCHTQEVQLFDVKYIISTTINKDCDECILIHIKMKDFPNHDLIRFYMLYDDPYPQSRPGCYVDVENVLLMNKLPKTFDFKHIRFLLMMCCMIKLRYYNRWLFEGEDCLVHVMELMKDEDFDIHYSKKTSYNKVVATQDLYDVLQSKVYKKIATIPLCNIKTIKLNRKVKRKTRR